MSDEEHTMSDDSYEYDSASGDELSDCEFWLILEYVDREKSNVFFMLTSC